MDNQPKPKVIYFGHPVNTYDTNLEKQLLNAIQTTHPSHCIENPNQPHHSEGYRQKGMVYFTEEVLLDCDIGIFLAFRDGYWGAGVFKEAKEMHKAGKKIFEIYQRGNYWYIEPMHIEVSEKKLLTVEETRARIRDKDRNPLPY